MGSAMPVSFLSLPTGGLIWSLPLSWPPLSIQWSSYLQSKPSNFWVFFPWRSPILGEKNGAPYQCIFIFLQYFSTRKFQRKRPGWYRNPQCHEVVQLQLYAGAFAPRQRSNLVGVIPSRLPQTKIALAKMMVGNWGKTFRCYVSSGRASLGLNHAKPLFGGLKTTKGYQPINQ